MAGMVFEPRWSDLKAQTYWCPRQEAFLSLSRARCVGQVSAWAQETNKAVESHSVHQHDFLPTCDSVNGPPSRQPSPLLLAPPDFLYTSPLPQTRRSPYKANMINVCKCVKNIPTGWEHLQETNADTLSVLQHERDRTDALPKQRVSLECDKTGSY